jgi:hypothetical protein
MPTTSSSWKKQGTDAVLELPEEINAADPLGFNQRVMFS